MPEQRNRDDDSIATELLGLYDLYRNALMNEKYFGNRLEFYRRANRAIEILLAITASGAVGSWAVWDTTLGTYVWKALGALSAILAIVKPIIQLSKQVELHSKVYIGYCSLYFDLKSLVNEIQRTHTFTKELRRDQRQASDRYRHLALQVDFPPKRKLLLKCWEEVNRQIPPRDLWMPGLEGEKDEN